MLEYGLVPTPEEGQFWEIRQSEHSPESRYLHLCVETDGLFSKRTKSLHDVYISSYSIKRDGYPEAVRQAAKTVVEDVTINFYLPTGRVR